MTFGLYLRSRFLIVAALSFPFSFIAAELPDVPTPLHPATNAYQGTTVIDNYEWLEDPSSPPVRDWIGLENARTRTYFDSLPFRNGIAQQLQQINTEESAKY